MRFQKSPLALALATSLGVMAIGCSGSKSTVTPTPTPDPSQLYFTPNMGSGSLATYAIDQTKNTFDRSTYGISGATITDAGTISTLSNGPVSLGATYIYGVNGSVTLQQPPPGSYAVELSGQAALVQLNTPAETTSAGYTIPAAAYFAPAVPTEACPSLTTAETFQFVTIPKSLPSSANSDTINSTFWNPKLETAYGSVQIATSGSSVAFSSVSQYTLPAENGGTPGSPSYPAPATTTGACSPSYYGEVISVPSASTIVNPGPGQATPPSATIGIGPSGFLVEDAGLGAADPTTGLTYENVLGAGYGAIGLPMPTSDITSSLTGAQFQGFLYAPGGSKQAFTLISSFGGYSNLQSSCATLLGQLSASNLKPSPNTIYGGEFTDNDPSSNSIGNCDLAIDLGTQQASKTNGLYTNITVYVGSSFPQNGLGTLYSFAAVAVAGQLQGKDAIFLIGADTTGSPSRAWGIYLLQSN